MAMVAYQPLETRDLKKRQALRYLLATITPHDVLY